MITVAIEILGDDLLEDDKETFFVELSSSDSATVFGIDRATKEICNDDTGKCSFESLGCFCLWFGAIRWLYIHVLFSNSGN